MDSPNDSDASEGMKELVERGFAIKSRREHLDTEVDYMRVSRAQVRDMDVSHVQRPLTLSVSAGVASTHGLTPVAYESAAAAGHNNFTVEYPYIN